MAVSSIGILRIPDGRDVFEPNGVTAINTKGESHVQTLDVLPPPWVITTHAGQIIPASCQVEHGSVAKDETEPEETLRGDAVVVVAFTNLSDITGRSVTDTPED